MNIKKIMLLVISCNTALLFANPDPKIFVENYYGSRIILVINGKDTPIFDIKAMNYNPVPLGSAKDIKTLSIRGTSLVASPTQLQDKLQQINREATANPNKNAVLIIGEYEGVRTPWNITVAWRSPNSPSEVATFSAKATQRQLELDFLALKSADERLRSIQSTKVLGNDIAQKANMICNANYAAGQKLGKINLCENLKRNLVKPEYIIDVRMIGKTSPNLEPTLQDIKTTIDSLYRTLQKYMQSGWAHKI